MPSTEDLLTLRDGEPLDAAARTTLAADIGAAREVERLRRMKYALRELPELSAPPGVFERVLAAQDTKRARGAGSWRWAASLGLAAAVALATIVYIGGSRSPAGAETAATGVVAPQTAQESAPIVPASFVSLVEQSGQLDRELAQISYQRPLMTGGAAGTIAGLEDRITLIDQQLSYGGVRGGLQATQQQVLWGERVELMNALVHMRYAQAQRTGF